MNDLQSTQRITGSRRVAFQSVMFFFSRMKQGALPRVAWFLKWLFGKVSKWVAPKVSEVVERMFLTLHARPNSKKT